MKKENLSDALNHINDDIINETANTRKLNKKHKSKRIIKSCIAACVVIAISITALTLFPKQKTNLPPQQDNNIADDVQLPTLTIDTITAGGDGMGFEGLMAYDISELTNANPWYEGCDIDTLPVYSNALTFNESYEPTNTNYDKMYEMLYDIAKQLNLDTDKIEAIQHDNEYHNPFPYLSFEDNGISITIQANLTALIDFNPAISLPGNYNFNAYATYKEMQDVAHYFKDEYKDVIGYKNPQENIFHGDYSWLDDDSVKQTYNIQFYDKTDDIKQDILNYNFYQIGFHSDYKNEGKLKTVIIYKPDLSQKIGDYPIVSVDGAKQLLANGNYITNVPHEFRGLEYIKKTELIYRISYREKTYIPYYRFYVELPENEFATPQGLKHYGFYYVPAVEGKYIENMPVYDGSFN